MDRPPGVKSRVTGAHRSVGREAQTVLGDELIELFFRFVGDHDVGGTRNPMRTEANVIGPTSAGTSTSGIHIVIVLSLPSGQYTRS
jgi:hypothetical protein